MPHVDGTSHDEAKRRATLIQLNRGEGPPRREAAMPVSFLSPAQRESVRPVLGDVNPSEGQVLPPR